MNDNQIAWQPCTCCTGWLS